MRIPYWYTETFACVRITIHYRYIFIAYLFSYIQHEGILWSIPNAIAFAFSLPPFFTITGLLHIKLTEVMIGRLILESIEPILKRSYPWHIFKVRRAITVWEIMLFRKNLSLTSNRLDNCCVPISQRFFATNFNLKSGRASQLKSPAANDDVSAGVRDNMTLI